MWASLRLLHQNKQGGESAASGFAVGKMGMDSMSKSSWRKQLRDGGGNCLDFAYFLFWNFDGNGIFSNFAKDFHAKGVRTNQSAHYGKRESDDIFMKSVY